MQFYIHISYQYHVSNFSTCLLEKSSEAVTQSSGVNQSRSESVPTPDNIQLMDTNPHNLDVGSVIEYDQNCGVIKWIGKLAGDTELTAGLEMVKYVKTCIRDVTIWVSTILRIAL